MLLAALHLAVFLFFVGLVLFLNAQDSIVGWVFLALAGSSGILYAILSISPLLSYNIPFRTPLSLLIVRILPLALSILLVTRSWFQSLHLLIPMKTRSAEPPHP